MKHAACSVSGSGTGLTHFLARLGFRLRIQTTLRDRDLRGMTGGSSVAEIRAGAKLGRCAHPKVGRVDDMVPGLLGSLDFDRWDEPRSDLDLRASLVGWLAYQRHEFQRKWRDLTPEQLAAWSIPPVQLSVLGLIRHMQQMEHAYLSWGLGGGDQLETYGDDDYAGGSAETVQDDVGLYLEEVSRADEAVKSIPALGAVGRGHGQPLGHTLIKMVDEYALHSGQAHMLRFAALGRLQR